ncbi:MAG: ParB/RepB/Spo0J family partition protein [Bacteroidota bacterium]
MSTRTIQNLQIGKVKEDPNQPRKTFREESLKELALSIKTYGVLQPITVRKTKEGYTIVMGNRRYRASKMAGKKTVPAIVREFKDDQIMEVQIIENLQRKDVEPIEEAEAISYLKEKHKPEEIAKRIGRTVQFVYSRLKLAQLIDGFRTYVTEGKLSISLAVAVSAFPAEEQQMMLEAIDGNFYPQRLEQLVKRQMCDLEQAPFDISNPKLVAKAGACTKCPFNAANQGNLFGEGKKLCTKSSCFQLKKQKSFIVALKRAKKEGMLFIPRIYSHDRDSEEKALILAQIEKEGLEIILKDRVDVLEKPTAPTLESVKQENRWYNYSEDEFVELFEQAKEQFKLDSEAFDSAEQSGFSKSLLFNPDSYKCTEVYAKVNEVKEKNTKALSLDERKMDDCTPEEQIIKIKGKEIRKKHIENNRLFVELANVVKEADYINNAMELSEDEIIAFCFSIYNNNVSYHLKNEVYKNLFGEDEQQDNETVLDTFKSNFDIQTFHKLVRYMIVSQLHFGESNHINNLTNASFYNAVKIPFNSEIEEIEKVYAEREKKRETRMNERIEELEGKSKELVA